MVLDLDSAIYSNFSMVLDLDSDKTAGVRHSVALSRILSFLQVKYRSLAHISVAYCLSCTYLGRLLSLLHIFRSLTVSLAHISVAYCLSLMSLSLTVPLNSLSLTVSLSFLLSLSLISLSLTVSIICLCL